MINSTIVTGIWDLNRGILSGGWGRKFSHYKDHFEKLLTSLGDDIPLVVFVDKELEDFVWNLRSKNNTAVYHHSVKDFDGNFFPFYNQVQSIRQNEKWLNQAGWLRDSTQAKLELYNPMVMSKMFLLHNAKIFNPFSTEYMFWLDGGITNTVHQGYFSHDKVIHKLENIVKKILFVCFPYETTSEIHGFDIKEMNKIAQTNVNRVARGGFFGGHIDYLSEANNKYYELLSNTLNSGYMGTEESIFTLMTYLDPEIYNHETIESNGLINTFFEKLKNNNVTVSQAEDKPKRKDYTNNNNIIYINTFNSPDQLQMVLDSFEKYDRNFLTKTKKILINNSIDSKYNDHYDSIVSKYEFIDHVRKGNLGVCGGRQFAAEHFADSGSKYMFFFEDDMLLDFEGKCNFGFPKKVNNLFDTLIKIMNIEEYDFLKFSFSEFYGHNGEQWSWHNVPSNNRMKYFGRSTKRPLTNFKHIKSINNTTYADGEIYYSNWPHIIDQEGNQKCFLDTKWERPFEQTWMSHIYTLTLENKVRPAILLSSPITHNRVHFYDSQIRKES
jgi:hypothetical protein